MPVVLNDDFAADLIRYGFYGVDLGNDWTIFRAGLLDDNGDELSGSGYARLPCDATMFGNVVLFDDPDIGDDLVFTVPAATITDLALYIFSEPDPVLTIPLSASVSSAAADTVTITAASLTPAVAGDLDATDSAHGLSQILRPLAEDTTNNQATNLLFIDDTANISDLSAMGLPSSVKFDPTPSDGIETNTGTIRWIDLPNGETLEEFMFRTSPGAVTWWRGPLGAPFTYDAGDDVDIAPGALDVSILGI